MSAALYIIRAGIDVTIIHNGAGALKKTDKIENYYGFDRPVSGADLYESGLSGARRLGAEIITGEVVGIEQNDGFTVKTDSGEFNADSVLLATGSPRKIPNIPGIREFEGSGVSYCAVCDAFFYRGLDVAVIGDGKYALHEAETLAAVAGSVTLLTNGGGELAPPPGIEINTAAISEIYGGDRVEGVKFQDGSRLSLSGVFIALGTAGSTALARTMGALTDENRIKTDENMATNLPGLYAAGDCTGGMLQISKAVCDGAVAGTEIIKFLKKKAL